MQERKEFKDRLQLLECMHHLKKTWRNGKIYQNLLVQVYRSFINHLPSSKEVILKLISIRLNKLLFLNNPNIQL